MKIQDWILTKKMFCDGKYIADGDIGIDKDKICDRNFRYFDDGETFKGLIEKIKTTDNNLFKNIPFYRGEDITLPKILHTRPSRKIYYLIDFDGKTIPFDYEKVRQVFTYTVAEYVTILKSSKDNRQYLLKFWDDCDEFCGVLNGCLPVNENEKYWN